MMEKFLFTCSFYSPSSKKLKNLRSHFVVHCGLHFLFLYINIQKTFSSLYIPTQTWAALVCILLNQASLPSFCSLQAINPRARWSESVGNTGRMAGASSFVMRNRPPLPSCNPKYHFQPVKHNQLR